MTQDELLTKMKELSRTFAYEPNLNFESALRAVVELTIKQLDTTNMPAEQVGWFNEGYNLAMDNILDVIEKELG